MFQMIIVLFFVSALLSSLPGLHSATYGNVSAPTCPSSFSCPALAPFKYPFYNATDTSCGLLKVNCTPKRGEILIGGRPYVILEKFDSDSSVLIYNRTFDELLTNNNTCEALMDNFTSPSPLLYSFSIEPFITLFKCPNNLGYAQQVHTYFNQRNYNSYNSCKHHDFYYKYLVGNATVPKDLPSTCQVILLPVKQRWQFYPKQPDETNISSLLSSGFSISFKLSPSCQECHKNSGQCNINIINGHFLCLDPKNGKTTIKLILVLTGSSFILLLSSVIFIIWRRSKSNPFSYISSKNKSPNLEEGSIICRVSVFSYSELQDATKSFISSHKLGDGGFGAVYYGKLQDGREVAVKRLYEHNYKRVQQFLNEVEILTRLRHPNLVVLYGCTSWQSHELLLVYEYIPNGTVAEHLHGGQENPSLLTWPMRMKIAIETASALAYLHASEIIHRDVKTDNILLDNTFCVKVADFGLSRLVPNNVTHVSTAPQGTPGYVDPQYHQRYQLTDKSDVYSFGVVLIELISSMVAVDLNRSQDDICLANLALNMIKTSAIDQLIDPVLESNSNPEIKNMITSVAELAFRCLQFDSVMRPTMNEVLHALMEIQDGKGIEDGGNIRDLETTNLPPLSEISDSVVLLKDFPPSPLSISSEWQSDNSVSTTVSSNGDRLPVKNRTSR
ncbi:putative protein kinase RLK-Pelle-WAK-LRK10L-1 family [Helianthus annuus]|nr:putative protein kinase RLK-Pelle-WAK-LRK10L-1 family [Helianthus annuus]KAJ0447641.1 putative protein kinase RLK-Pelle-WAK-LRK10L-1 family [Helianthus annuus]KAJ0632544.1 putative protein kinase RLK-Pelle-WAK-LRK10L-1 family [Helianthus annuus]KAJ0826437.1 putative protein kinase RLK-Pelle-WAK-LRK10L-1 family [Helianthus annuus]